MERSQYGLGPRGAVVNDDFLASLNFTRNGSSARQPTIESQAQTLKGLQQTAHLTKHQGAVPDLPPTRLPLMGGTAPVGASLPLMPPGTSSPQDSLAPAHRSDLPIASSVSGPISQPLGNGSTGQAPSLPLLGGGMATQDFPDLPDDFPDLFGGLEVPTLEDLVKDIYTAEAEYINDSGVVTTKAKDLTRANTLPLPSELARLDTEAMLGPPEVMFPLEHLERTGSGLRKRKSLDVSLDLRHVKLHPKPQEAPARGPAMLPLQNTSQTASAAAAQRGGADNPQPWKPLVFSDNSMRLSLQQQQQPVSAFASKDMVVPQFGGAPDYHISDQALLDRVDVPPSAFAAHAGAPLDDQSAPERRRTGTGLTSFASLPNRHWLSSAAYIHAVSASKPGDEEVLRWLLIGK